MINFTYLSELDGCKQKPLDDWEIAAEFQENKSVKAQQVFGKINHDGRRTRLDHVTQNQENQVWDNDDNVHDQDDYGTRRICGKRSRH